MGAARCSCKAARSRYCGSAHLLHPLLSLASTPLQWRRRLHLPPSPPSSPPPRSWGWQSLLPSLPQPVLQRPPPPPPRPRPLPPSPRLQSLRQARAPLSRLSRRPSAPVPPTSTSCRPSAPRSRVRNGGLGTGDAGSGRGNVEVPCLAWLCLAPTLLRPPSQAFLPPSARPIPCSRQPGAGQQGPGQAAGGDVEGSGRKRQAGVRGTPCWRLQHGCWEMGGAVWRRWPFAAHSCST